MLIVAITAITAFALAIAFWLRTRPSWWYLRDRKPDLSVWQSSFGPDQMPVVLAALRTVSEAFLLRREDILKLRPEDKLHEIYRAAYPNTQTPDALEFEVLSKQLIQHFNVPEATLIGERHPTVQDVVVWCLRYSGA